MTQWAIISTSDNAWLSGPLDEEPAMAAGQRAIRVPLDFPDTWSWSPSHDGFVPKVTASATVSRLAYQRLFTQAERIAIRASSDPVVTDFRALAELADTIDLADADVVAGTHYLEQLTLIGSGRAASILAGSPPA